MLSAGGEGADYIPPNSASTSSQWPQSSVAKSAELNYFDRVLEHPEEKH